MVSIEDIQTLAAFPDDAEELPTHIMSNKRPMVLAVDGGAALVVQDLEAYKRLLDLAANSSATEGIRQGLEDLAAGRIRPAQEVFDEMRVEYGLAR